MTLGTRLSIASAILWLSVAAVSAFTSRQASPAPRSHNTSPAQAPDGTRRSADYAGSAACSGCHPSQYAQWHASLHVRMTKPIAEAAVLGDFSAAGFSAHGRTYRFGTRDGRPFIAVKDGSRPEETFDVDYTLGAKRYQGYLSTLPDGRIYVLPAFWHVATRRWVDWKEITPLPEEGHGLRQIWNSNCFNCHATNIARGFDVPSKTFTTTWTEMGITCESCHGPGGPHVALMAQWAADPASRPDYDRRTSNTTLGDTLRIFSPRTASKREVVDTCGYCHGNKTNVFVGFRPGDTFEDYALPFLISTPIPSNDIQGEFWPDGRPNRFNRPQALMLSGCFKAGAIACTNCHVAHGSPSDHSLKVDIHDARRGDLLCTQCHTGPSGAPVPAADGLLRPRVGARPLDARGSMTPWTDADLEAHTHHAASSAGSRCIGCHMSDMNWRLLIRRRDHTFEAPVPEETAAFGVPNACNTCHDDKTPEWAAGRMDAWWGDGRRRRGVLDRAETMYRAGAHDVGAIPGLTALMLDRTQGVVVRASAADFIGQLVMGNTGGARGPAQTSFAGGERPAATPGTPRPEAMTPALVNALVGAASDPEPMVRVEAVKALAAAGPRRVVVASVSARLVDPVRLVRTAAAEVLLAFGITTLPGPAGTALARAQDELAESLSVFPDSAGQQTARAWLEAERGRTAAAQAALEAAISLDPTRARPLVIQGVIAARENRFDEAVRLWKKARALEPSYPNIDRLIAEAEGRKPGG